MSRMQNKALRLARDVIILFLVIEIILLIALLQNPLIGFHADIRVQSIKHTKINPRIEFSGNGGIIHDTVISDFPRNWSGFIHINPRELVNTSFSAEGFYVRSNNRWVELEVYINCFVAALAPINISIEGTTLSDNQLVTLSIELLLKEDAVKVFHDSLNLPNNGSIIHLEQSVDLGSINCTLRAVRAKIGISKYGASTSAIYMLIKRIGIYACSNYGFIKMRFRVYDAYEHDITQYLSYTYSGDVHIGFFISSRLNFYFLSRNQTVSRGILIDYLSPETVIYIENAYILAHLRFNISRYLDQLYMIERIIKNDELRDREFIDVHLPILWAYIDARALNSEALRFARLEFILLESSSVIELSYIRSLHEAEAIRVAIIPGIIQIKLYVDSQTTKVFSKVFKVLDFSVKVSIRLAMVEIFGFLISGFYFSLILNYIALLLCAVIIQYKLHREYEMK